MFYTLWRPLESKTSRPKNGSDPPGVSGPFAFIGLRVRVLMPVHVQALTLHVSNQERQRETLEVVFTPGTDLGSVSAWELRKWIDLRGVASDYLLKEYG